MFFVIVICQVINHVFFFFLNCYMSGSQSCFLLLLYVR